MCTVHNSNSKYEIDLHKFKMYVIELSNIYIICELYSIYSNNFINCSVINCYIKWQSYLFHKLLYVQNIQLCSTNRQKLIIKPINRYIKI